MGDDAAPTGTSASGEPGRRPTDLPLVGPATAAAIDAADFDATDIAERRVSYVMLREAGINPGVAARMRRHYSLVWAFRWRFGGEDLPDRAAQVRGFEAPERSWVDESARPVEAGDDDAIQAWQDWVDRSFDSADATQPETCPRCTTRLVTYSLGERERVHCESCGYAAVDVVRRDARNQPAVGEGDARDDPDSWVAVLEAFRQRSRRED